MKRDNAFTGLEAAIVLIAFVVVAAIFSYVLLGAGFFATQKAQEVTYAGIKQTTSNAVIDGSLYANTTSAGLLDGFMFNVRVPLGGEAVDMSTTTFLFTSSRNTTPQRINVFDSELTNRDQVDEPCCGAYNLTAYYPQSKVPVLTSGEFATFMLSIQKGEELRAKQWFALEMRPLVGAATLITKTLGSGMSSGEVL
ncbi:MAG: flagellin [Euryarchaeota archaeon]|nr:flagellin [Euryarchaeota archaeon]